MQEWLRALIEKFLGELKFFIEFGQLRDWLRVVLSLYWCKRYFWQILPGGDLENTKSFIFRHLLGSIEFIVFVYVSKFIFPIKSEEIILGCDFDLLRICFSDNLYVIESCTL